jgi:hypothetical protein
MSRLNRAMSGLGRAVGQGAAYLLPAERRDWAEAVWAEAHEVPPGLRRLAWRAGGVRLIAKGCWMQRRMRNAVLFAAAAAYLTWTAVPGTPSAVISADIWLRAIGTVVLLAGLPWLMRRRLGPVMDSRLARSLRLATFAGIMALIVALAGLDRIKNTRGLLASAGPHDQPSIGLLIVWTAFLVALAGYAAGILAVTANRSWVTSTTLSIGTGTGVALGVVMYAIMPLGFDKYATAPWLPGSAMDPVVVTAWILLFGGPLAAALLAGWRCRASVGPMVPAEAKIRQGIVAGLLVTLVGSLVVCVLGPATLASFSWLAHLLYPGQHLTSAAIAHRGANLAGDGAPGYSLVWFFFPIIGLGVGSLTGLVAWGNRAVRERGHGPGGGGPGGAGPMPEPPPAGLPVDTGYEPASVAVGVYASTRVS